MYTVSYEEPYGFVVFDYADKAFGKFGTKEDLFSFIRTYKEDVKFKHSTILKIETEFRNV